MIMNSRVLFVFLFAAACSFGALLFSSEARADRRLDVCERVSSELQVECVFGVIEQEMKRGNIEAAMRVFSVAYERFVTFVQPGCHTQAHRVGDLAYYRIYRVHGDISRMEFPQSTTACGYGFFHGFLEHITQQTPTAAAVDEVCTHLSEQLSAHMRDIRPICYHGSGHGFMLAVAETISEKYYGNAWRFAKKPLEICDSLSRADAADKEQCKEGVFNVLVTWMELGQYGFSYDRKQPFRTCDELPPDVQGACYYEVAQKLDGLADLDPVKVADIASHAKNIEQRLRSFQVGIAGIVQNVIWKEDGTERVLERCSELSGEYYRACLLSVVNGLFEHGSPQEEYAKALDACESPSVVRMSAEALCYSTVANRLSRFYEPERSLDICGSFPAPHDAACKEEVEAKGSAI